MPRGRKRRLKNFVQRAKDFEKDAAKGSGFKEVDRNTKKVPVGVGKHKRLRYKKNKKHELRFASVAEGQLHNLIESGKLKPKNYVLAKVPSSEHLGVQEYFNKPSLFSVKLFLEAKAKNEKVPDFFSKENYLLCKNLLSQFKGIDLKKIERTQEEFTGHLEKHTWFQSYYSSNFIVLGMTKNGKLRLALVDH